MQKMFFFLSRDSAKLVPIDNVAGSAGGTTIVIKSNARTMIKCQANFLTLACKKVKPGSYTYLKSNEVDE